MKVLQTLLILFCMMMAFLLIVFVDCLHDFAPIKPGMTRVEVEKLFPMEPGFQSPSDVRFRHPRSPYFHVKVGFSLKRHPECRAMFCPDDRVTTVSLPYFRRPIFD